MAREDTPVSVDTFFCDVSRLGKIRLSGEDAPEFVKVMTTVDLWRLETAGKVAPALILNAEGNIIDLVMIGRSGEREYILITHPDTVDELTQWLTAHAELKDSQGAPVFKDLKVSDATERIAAYALYGLKARMILDDLTKEELSDELGEKTLSLVTIGELQVMLIRWPLLRAHALDSPLMPGGDVFEVYLPVKAAATFEEILLGFPEIDPESFEEYVQRRRAVHTWFDAAEEAAYIKPESAGLKALLRSSHDFVGAKALQQLGFFSHSANS